MVSVNGKEYAQVQLQESVETLEAAESFGVYAANQLLERGADRILAAIQAKKMTQPGDLGET